MGPELAGTVARWTSSRSQLTLPDDILTFDLDGRLDQEWEKIGGPAPHPGRLPVLPNATGTAAA